MTSPEVSDKYIDLRAGSRNYRPPLLYGVNLMGKIQITSTYRLDCIDLPCSILAHILLVLTNIEDSDQKKKKKTNIEDYFIFWKLYIISNRKKIKFQYVFVKFPSSIPLKTILNFVQNQKKSNLKTRFIGFTYFVTFIYSSTNMWFILNL